MKSTAQRADAEPERWSTPEFERAAALLRDRYGLVFPPSRRHDVEQTMHRAMQKRGITDAARWSDTIARGSEPIDDVIAELTIGESYFFREPAQLDFVRDMVLPSAAAARTGATARRPFRLWSAGCATGEEPYSLAMMLREARWDFGAHPADIIGTDLSVVRLAAAKRGQYGAWALRGMTEKRRERFFEPKGRQWSLDPSIRSMVEFRLLNLAEDAYPEPATGIFGMDVIFCRNVLIYFDMATVKSVANRLINSLSDDGWLFLGASDPPLADLVPCAVVTTPAGLAYRRPKQLSAAESGSNPAQTAPTRDRIGRQHEEMQDATLPRDARHKMLVVAAAEPAKVSRRPVSKPTDGASDAANSARTLEAAYAESRYADVADLAREVVQTGDAAESIWLLWVRALANDGRLLEAAAVCAAGLDRHGGSAELSYLDSVLLAQTGRYAEAAAAARRSLYLDRTLAVAHLALGDSLAHTGDMAGAARSFRNGERILAELPPDALVRGTDGETAARLAQIAHYRATALTSTKATRTTSP